ncbi:class I SAM-dependent methyltransferase [Cohnella luojiensis]|uniref:Class I SAM-dependent methyltransferase n=1 Tax=Cohnella luojiensis TaxID=652876 RepID=A0A4Y8M9R3_9BACL|nr:class I SAM-dependent methyltransferase [Cohnella luojiensis]TFE31855.1 class I SAM-dependent methyltransferase [Cohnella luojiensis]
MSKEKLIRKFDKQARLYEVRRKKKSERVWREKLISCAKGRVLEVSVGAGANFHYYSKDVQVTAIDFSPEMLNKAKQAAVEIGIQAEFIHSDVESLSFPDESFDTIVSTLSFCGYEDPQSVLGAFQKWCKRDGQILLLEHGISSNRIIGGLQTIVDPLFKKVVGCRLNRDMVQILQQSNLHINKMENYMFGAVHLVWAAPNKN